MPRLEDSDPVVFDGYWDRGRVEEEGHWSTPEEAVAWGLQRTPKVYIRFWGEPEYRWAGEGDSSEGLLTWR